MLSVGVGDGNEYQCIAYIAFDVCVSISFDSGAEEKTINSLLYLFPFDCAVICNKL